jgi:hypothetical protein
VIPASRVYQTCRDLFDTYPLAVVVTDHVPTMQSMVLMLADGADISFFVLVQDCGDGRPAYTIIPWHAEGPVTIESDGGDVPDLAASAVMRGVPIPRHGSLFGWICGEPVTALIVVYASYTPDRPVPTWSVMPLAETAEAQWPPFTDEHLFGHWFWDHHQAGTIINLGDAIAATAETVFWLGTYAALGSDCCVVACDVKAQEGHILRRGTYVDSATLRADVAVPTTAELLAHADKTDLAPRFQVPAQCG